MGQSWVKRVAQTVTQKIESQHRQHDRQAGVKDKVWRSENLIPFQSKH
jgi:hypothetical protein